MVFVNLPDLIVHEINVHYEKLYQCQSRIEIFADQNEFKNHVRAAHNTMSASLYSVFRPDSNNADDKKRRIIY